MYIDLAGDVSQKVSNLSARPDGLNVMIVYFSLFLDTLEAIQVDCDPSARSNVISYFASMTKFGFVISLFVAERILQYTRPLCDSLQSETCDLVKSSR